MVGSRSVLELLEQYSRKTPTDLNCAEAVGLR